MPDVANMLTDDKATVFRKDFMVYDYWQRADNPEIRVDAKYDHQNVLVKGGFLLLKQKGYSGAGHVSMAGIQSKRLDILYGTFRTTSKVFGDNGGSCASFFWYRDDRNELDIELVTYGDSLVNDTINFTTHPSTDENGLPIPGATFRIPTWSTGAVNPPGEFREFRFDWDPTGIQYIFDHEVKHEDSRVPTLGGNLQLKLWADGNKWWSGTPSTTDVTMMVSGISAYFNTTGNEWFEQCSKAGGPSDETICTAEFF